MLKKLFTILFACMLICYSCSKVMAKDDLEISNDFFSFTMPKETKNTYTAEKQNNGIYICEKFSKQSGMSGFAFGLKIYKNPDDYITTDGNKKIGELTDKNGNIYDMVLIRPTDVNYNDNEKIKQDYTRLYDFGNIAGENIKGVNGYTYFNNRGIKGEDLYGEILKKYKSAITEDWSYSKYIKEDLNSIYMTFSKSNKKTLKKAGYCYYDINGDGIEELFLGKIEKGKSKGIIYDIYTMVDRKPKLVNRGKVFICNDKFLWDEYQPKDKKKITTVYFLEKNSVKLEPYVVFTYDGNTTGKSPWAITYGIYGKPGFVTKNEFNKNIKTYQNFKRFDFTPLSEFK